MALKKKIAILGVVLVILVVGGFLLWGAVETYTGLPSFCGTTCHIMDKPYKSWQKDLHSEKKVACVKCHYAPGEKKTLRAKMRSAAQGIGYAADPKNPHFKEVRKRAPVTDASCSMKECHPAEKILDKKIRYTNLAADSKFMKGVDKAALRKKPVEYKSLDEIKAAGGMPFIHKTHMEKLVEGQKMHCNTCHQHVGAETHFEVPKELCSLCHFKNAKYNEGRAKCSLCHIIPDKNLRKEAGPGKAPDADSKEEKKEPITHQSLEKNKVSCQSCHFVVLGSADIKLQACSDCHDEKAKLEFTKKERSQRTKADIKLMHENHVAHQSADCFQCHGSLDHRKVVDYAKAITDDCTLCHGETHAYQRMLLAGNIIQGQPEVPGLMNPVNTNCMGCHTKMRHDDVKGITVSAGTDEGCVGCHTKRHTEMLKEWKEKTAAEVKSATEVEQQAIAALKKARSGKAPKDKLAKAEAMFNEAEKYLNVVRHGNGVHNKKYSLILLDTALGKFEEMINYLEKGN